MGFAYLPRCVSARPPYPPFVTTGHSRSKNGVTSLAYDPVVHGEAPRTSTVQILLFHRRMDCRVKPGNDEGSAQRSQ
jgi:hypothetical protein